MRTTFASIRILRAHALQAGRLPETQSSFRWRLTMLLINGLRKFATAADFSGTLLESSVESELQSCD